MNTQAMTSIALQQVHTRDKNVERHFGKVICIPWLAYAWKIIKKKFNFGKVICILWLAYASKIIKKFKFFIYKELKNEITEQYSLTSLDIKFTEACCHINISLVLVIIG